MTASEKSLDHKTLTRMGGTRCGHLGSAKCDSFKYQTANQSPGSATCSGPAQGAAALQCPRGRRGARAAFPRRQLCSRPPPATGGRQRSRPHLGCTAHPMRNQAGESRDSASRLIRASEAGISKAPQTSGEEWGMAKPRSKDVGAEGSLQQRCCVAFAGARNFRQRHPARPRGNEDQFKDCWTPSKRSLRLIFLPGHGCS